MTGDRTTPTEVDEKEVMDYCSEMGYFYLKINGENGKGLKEAFEYCPCTYMLKKEHTSESLIFR
jgi:hypothetical protein